jgi:hypothetical protein
VKARPREARFDGFGNLRVRFELLAGGADAPDGVSDVIGNQKRSALVDGASDRPSSRLSVRVDEIGYDILRFAIGAPGATAVLAMADMEALSVIEEAHCRGLNVPSDISVVGFNNIPEAAAANLTTIDSNGAEKGRVAARLLFSAGQVRHEILPTLLVVHGTTAVAPPHERNAG